MVRLNATTKVVIYVADEDDLGPTFASEKFHFVINEDMYKVSNFFQLLVIKLRKNVKKICKFLYLF